MMVWRALYALTMSMLTISSTGAWVQGGVKTTSSNGEWHVIVLDFSKSIRFLF